MSALVVAADTAASTLPAAQYLALVVLLGVACQWLAWQLRVPSLLILLLAGFGFGQWVSAEEVLGRDVLFAGVSITVGIILFEGSLSLRLSGIRDLGRPIIRLCSLTVLIAWTLITSAAWLLGFDLRVALLVGAILVVTGPTVINPILRQLRPTRRVASLLRWEGIVVDPIGAVLAVLVYQAVVAGEQDALPMVLLGLGRTLLVSFGIALLLGLVLSALMRRHAIPDFLHGVVFLSAAVSALVASDALQPESGLLTVTVLGVFLANRPGLHLQHVLEFKEHLQVLFVGGLFIVLAGRVAPEALLDVAPVAAAFVLVLVVLVRPVSVLLGLWGTDATRDERTLLVCMAPRGIVAAAVTSIFALEFSRAARLRQEEAAAATGPEGRELTQQAADLAALATQVDRMVPLVFIVIVATVTLYGLGVGRLAERLGLATTSPQGVLFAGKAGWVTPAAARLQELNVPALIVSNDDRALQPARMAGLRTEPVNILSDYAVQDMDLAGIRQLLACMPDDDANTIATREFAHALGRSNTFQVRRADTRRTPNGERPVVKRPAESHQTSPREPGERLSGRPAFVPALTHDELEGRVTDGWRVTRTRLSDAFTLADFTAQHGGRAVVMFVHNDSGTKIASEDSSLPERDATLIALVPAAPSPTT